VAELESAGDPLLRHDVHGKPSDLLAGEDDLAGGRFQHTRDQVEHGRFAGAVRTDDGADLAGVETHVDRVDGDERAEAAH